MRTLPPWIKLVEGGKTQPADAGPVDRSAPARESLPPELPQVPWSLPGPPPPHGGLHQLTLGEVELKPRPAFTALDFSAYRIGGNNRALLGGIVKDLEETLGVRPPWGYGRRAEARCAERRGIGFGRGGGYVVGEGTIDEMLAGLTDPVARKAVAAFVVAHEFFHAYLAHPSVIDGYTRDPPGLRVRQRALFRPLCELQADYLAARYLRARGLPLEPVIERFQTGHFPPDDEYPAGAERAENVRRAAAPEFEVALFHNEIVDCLALLELLAGR